MVKCKSKLKSGKPCKNRAVFGDYCNIHYQKLKKEHDTRTI